MKSLFLNTLLSNMPKKQKKSGPTKRVLEKQCVLSNGYKECLSEINAFLNGGDCGAQTLQGCYKTLFRHFKVRGDEASALRSHIRRQCPHMDFP